MRKKTGQNKKTQTARGPNAQTSATDTAGRQGSEPGVLAGPGQPVEVALRVGNWPLGRPPLRARPRATDLCVVAFAATPPARTQPAAAHPARPRAVVLAVYGAGGGHRSRPPGRPLRLLPVRRHPVRPSRPPPPPPLALAVDHPHPGHVVSATTISPRGVPSVGRFARRARRRCTSPPPARACAGPPLTAVDLPSVSGGDGVCLPCCCRRWWPSGLGRYRLHCQPSVDADRPASVPHFSRGRPARQRGA